MRGLGYALIVVGVIGAVLIFLYPFILNWSGLIGAVGAVLAGAGFFCFGRCDSDCKTTKNNCSCNRY